MAAASPHVGPEAPDLTRHVREYFGVNHLTIHHGGLNSLLRVSRAAWRIRPDLPLW